MSHDETTKGGLTPRELQKYHFHIISCRKMIENTWEEVSKKTLTSAWKNLWKESIVECNFEGFETVLVEPAVSDIVSLSKITGLDVKKDIDELEEDQSQKLTTEEIMETLATHSCT
ncbi:hypothetical protein AVEN_121578-1 [Araneus ventricosus]|uniref:DDE-1 domain-containing protein n=1 Tax=Araneus ventricosus TaxID=182803 RepID=A0A4Y2B224_ARAVE|nr:hypothetical protein AVEN_121578-1 [Araneus ventricosus]